MKRWIFSAGILGVAMVFVAPQVNAAFIITQDCDGISELSEPLDAHTEFRFLRYMRSNSFPRSFNSDEQLQRWCYLWNDQKVRNIARRSRGLNARSSRTLDERFYKVKDEDRGGEFIVVPEGNFEDLPQSRKARILARVNSDNCDPGGRTETELEEYAFCLQLQQERNTRREEILKSRRNIAGGGSFRLLSFVEERRTRRLAGQGSKFSPSDRSSLFKRAESEQAEFDPEGPGSKPLFGSKDNRIMRYARREDCARLRTEEEKTRCQWLVAQDRFRTAGQREQVKKRVRTSGVSASTRLRRGVNQEYRASIGTTQSLINRRRLEGGFRPTPRTIQDLKDYKEPVVVPSECEIDPLHCN